MSVDRSLAACRLQPRSVTKGQQQRVVVECPIEPGDGAGRVPICSEQSQVDRQNSLAPQGDLRLQHQGHREKGRAGPSAVDWLDDLPRKA